MFAACAARFSVLVGWGDSLNVGIGCWSKMLFFHSGCICVAKKSVSFPLIARLSTMCWCSYLVSIIIESVEFPTDIFSMGLKLNVPGAI